MKQLLLLLLIIAFCSQSCETNNNYIPDVYVQFQIPLTEIGGIGQAVYTNENYGVKGIIIYHEGFNNYLAFDRACSYAPEEKCEKVELDNLLAPSLLVDSCCGSIFLSYTLQQKVLLSLPLKQYHTVLTEVICTLVIKFEEPN